MPLYTPSPVTYSSNGILTLTAPLSGDVRPYVGIWDRFRNQKVWLLGATTTARCSTTGVSPEAGSSAFYEFTTGYWWAAQARGLGARLRYNSGVSGYTTAQIKDAYLAGLQSGIAADRTITVLNLQENNLPAAADYANAQIILYSELALGKRVVLVVPTAYASALDSQLQNYAAYQAWCWKQRALFPGRVSVADHYSVLGRLKTGVTTLDGVLPNTYGSWIAGSTWGVVANDFFGGPIKEDPEALGTIVADLSPATVSSWGKNIVSTVINSAGEIEATVTANGSNGYIACNPFTTSAGDMFSLYFDFSVDTATPQHWNAGPSFVVGGSTATQREFGVDSSDGDLAASFSGNVEGVSAPTLGIASAANYVRFYCGNVLGSKVRIRRVCLIKL